MQNASLLRDGYVVDVPYPTFVHRQAMPLWLTTITTLQGVVSPDLEKPYRYLELGCAMGIHLHLTAAANPKGHFVGVDFNAQHLLVAKEGLETTGINNLEFIQASFTELVEKEIEPFDFIVTHGVWSWIAEEHQEAILKIVDRLLKPNGIFYCSYMSHPGATGLTSIQKLMYEMSRNLRGNSASKAIQGLNLARTVGQHKIGLFEKIPTLNQQLLELAEDKPNYVAHDFLSAHWKPQHSADMIRKFGKIGLAYTASAGVVDNIPALTLPPEIQKIIKTLPLVTLQETVKDIARNTLQRQDIYIRDQKKQTFDQQQYVYETLNFGLLPNAPIGKDLRQDDKLGNIKDVIGIFERIIKLLAQREATISTIHNLLKLNISLVQLSEIVLVLVWAGYIHPLNMSPQSKYESSTNDWMLKQQLPWRCIARQGTAVEKS
ncbi:tRNA (guanine-N(7)-)-methyltransferase [compost metagenome]